MLRPYLKKAPAGAASRADAVSLLCVLAEASAAGVDKAKAACTADKVWALTLKAKDSFLWQDSSAATEREAAALLRRTQTQTQTQTQIQTQTRTRTPTPTLTPTPTRRRRCYACWPRSSSRYPRSSHCAARAAATRSRR